VRADGWRLAWFNLRLIFAYRGPPVSTYGCGKKSDHYLQAIERRAVIISIAQFPAHPQKVFQHAGKVRTGQESNISGAKARRFSIIYGPTKVVP
jgi:hypothetical protein